MKMTKVNINFYLINFYWIEINLFFFSVLFSPAPTELEMQQEILSERLKNYKSLHGLTSTTTPVPVRNDEINNSFISISSLKDKG